LFFALEVAFSLVYSDRLAADWEQTAVAGALFMLLALVGGLVLGRLLRLPPGNGVTVGTGFTVRNVAVAQAVAITPLKSLVHASCAVVYYLTEILPVLGTVAMYRR